ncbi:MAG: hypothetical protein CM1200mP7_1620 [Chloroflexota bacterium]|nr:MAG: hypothetical protein CM1200mP7_1620 [Chloroflexota bacterium]
MNFRFFLGIFVYYILKHLLRLKMKFPEPFYYSNIRLLWLARFFASAGSFFQFVVIGWLTYEYTQSRFLTSLSWGAGALASVVSAPIGGFAAEKWERQKVIVYVFLIKSICFFIFAYLVFLTISIRINFYFSVINWIHSIVSSTIRFFFDSIVSTF